MPNQQPIITSENGRREFACSPAAVVAFIVNEQEQVLLSVHAKRNRWEVVSGALEAEETILDGALREVTEELGPEIRVRPLGVLHASTWRYDDNAQFMISICYLMAYEGGEVQTGDDMKGGEYRWWELDELVDTELHIGIPRERWLFQRAIELYRIWKDQEVELQPHLV
ncbi:MAG: NUDIX domain-containing protein [Chloroflexota bacterium]